MGYLEWLELVLFGIAILIAVVLLAKCRRQGSVEVTAPSAITVPARPRLLSTPELQIVVLGLPLELLWEVAQFPLYRVWHEGDWSYILYGLAHCTLGDLFILLAVFWIVALLNRNRRWYRDSILLNGSLFTIFGVGYTIYSEIENVRVKGTWEYTELMPVVPLIEIGGMPFLQWVLIPPVLLWLMRLLTLSAGPR